MSLYARTVKGLYPFPHSCVGILAIKQLDLLEGPSVGLYPVKTAHLYNMRRHCGKLVNPGLVLA